MTAPMNQRIAVPIDDPDADSEWNDILRQHKIIPEKPPSPTPMVEEALLEAHRLAHENRLEGKEIDELDELEDEEDDEFIEVYRQKRMAEIAALQKKSAFGSVYLISKPEYSKEVTEASVKGPVFVNLISSTGLNVESRVLQDLWRQAAKEYADVKFCEMPAAKAIENYPEANCPTILVYKDGDIAKQVVTLAMVGGRRANMMFIDQLLVDVGAVADNDMRVIKRRRGAEDAEEDKYFQNKTIKSSKLGKKGGDSDSDEDWD